MNYLYAAGVVILLCGSSLAQHIKLNGRLQTDQKIPVRNTRVTVAGGQTGLTDANGRFSIDLSTDLKEGERVIINVQKKGWVINHPLDGEWNLPNMRLQNIQTLDVIIVPLGSKALWTDARIEKELKANSDRIAKLQIDANQRKEIDFTQFLEELAGKYGTTPTATKEAFDSWANAVEKSTDSHIKGLRDFYNQKFPAAAKNFKEAATQGEENVAEDWRLAGNSALLAYDFRDAIESYSQSQNLISKIKHAEKWAEVTNLLGIAKRELGVRTEGDEAIKLLSESACAFKQNLLIYAREKHPLDWAMTQNGLGNALQEQGIRVEVEEGQRLLSEAVTAFRQALLVYSRDQMPRYWAAAQNNLGIALQEQGKRAAGSEGQRLLSESITAFREALTVFNHELLPEEWAMTQNNLGNTLAEQGSKTQGQEGDRLLSDAVTAFRGALTVYTREHRPQQWAATQNNLAGTLQEQGKRASGQERVHLLSQAVRAYREVLTVYTREHLPQQWAITQNNLGTALNIQGTAAGGQEGRRLLTEAVTALRLALTVYTREHLPQQWAAIQSNLGANLQEQGATAEGQERVRLLTEAVTAYQDALTVYTFEHLPQDWATTQKDLAQTFVYLSDWANAAQCYENVLKVDPGNLFAYQRASFLEQEVLFDYKMAFALNESWLRQHPDDLWAMSSFAEKHFTTGRFDQCEQRIAMLLPNEKLDVRVKIALRTIEIANLLALNQSSNVPAKIKFLIEVVSSQEADFQLGWSVEGTKHFISQDERLNASKDWLSRLFSAMSGENRDAIVTRLKVLSENFIAK